MFDLILFNKVDMNFIFSFKFQLWMRFFFKIVTWGFYPFNVRISVQ